MKKLLYILMLVAAFTACKNKPKTTLKDSVTTVTQIKSNQTLIDKFKPVIQGAWVKSDYIDEVIKTKSPAAASDLASGLTEMIIETDSIKADSLLVNGGWNNHEGGDLMLKFKPGKVVGTIILGDFDLGYTVNNNDTTLITYAYDKDKKTTVVTKYRKALNKRSKNLGDGMDYLINEGLFAGKYTVINTLGKRYDITLTKTGIITGFLNYKNYYIQNDLNEEPMNNLDGIIFDLYTKHQVSYTFKFRADTLNLLTTLSNADSTEQVVGKLQYKFIKRK